MIRQRREPESRPYEERRADPPPVPPALAAGNRALARMLEPVGRELAERGGVRTRAAQPSLARADGGLLDGVMDAARAMMVAPSAFAEVRIEGSVGREGDNKPLDVAIIVARLALLGFADANLGAAVERYQREAVEGLHSPDGRVDPAGATIKALRAGKSGRASAPPSGPTAPGAPTAAPAVPSAPDGPAAVGDALVAEITADLETLARSVRGLRMDSTEAEGSERDDVIGLIKGVRAKIARVTDADRRAAFFRRINELSPSYYQSKNMNLLEMDETRTCNITSVGMALEALGVAPTGSEGGADLKAIAETYPEAIGGAADRVGGDLVQLRLPDYLQLVAVAEVLGDAAPTTENIRHAGARMETDAKGRTEVEGAWKEIKNIHFLAKLARRFGVSAEVVTFNLTSNDPTDEKERKKHRLDDFTALRGIGSRHRDDVEKMVDARNRREQLDALPPGAKGRKKLEEAVAKDEKSGVLAGDALSPASLAEQEEQIPLQEYMDRVRETIGAPLDEGAQVVVAMSGHFVRLQAIGADHVIVDDPATRTSANRKVTWQEARAMGYFQSCLVIR